MRILIVTDKSGSAIDRLAHSIQRHLIYHKVAIIPIHPKRNDVETLVEVQKLMMWADIIDIHYWKSGQVLRQTFPAEFNSKPKILFHFNPYDIGTEENQHYKQLVVGNKEIHNKSLSSTLIPYGLNLEFFRFNEEYTKEKIVMMSVNRIEGKKGVREVAQVCKELDYKFILVGRVSKPEYMREVMEVGGKNMQFIENATDEELRITYYKSAIHICNSVDGYESGTLPILEAMACGVPVLTRMIGHVPDLDTGGNMIVRMGKQEDTEDLKKQLKDLMENEELRLKIRGKAWETVRIRDERRMVIDINKIYQKFYKPNSPLVSIIIPTKDHPESFTECLLGAVQQDYPNFEIIVSDSGEAPVKRIVDEVKKQTEVPIRYIHFPHNNKYTLSEARNKAVIESDGKLLVFCDDRLKMDKHAVSVFATYHRSKSWLWGSKDKIAKGFVENFSCISRSDLISNGMFCESIQWYGGMTNEIRERFEKRNNFDFIFLQEAEASAVKRASSKSGRRKDIIEAKYLIHKMYGK